MLRTRTRKREIPLSIVVAIFLTARAQSRKEGSIKFLFSLRLRALAVKLVPIKIWLQEPFAFILPDNYELQFTYSSSPFPGKQVS
jgi:hypothetical protein